MGSSQRIVSSSWTANARGCSRSTATSVRLPRSGGTPCPGTRRCPLPPRRRSTAAMTPLRSSVISPSTAEAPPPAVAMSASTDRCRPASTSRSMTTMAGSPRTVSTTSAIGRASLVGCRTRGQPEGRPGPAAGRRPDWVTTRSVRRSASRSASRSRTSGWAMIRLVVTANVSLSRNVPERPGAHVGDERQGHEEQQRDAEQERTEEIPSAQR